MAGYIKLSSVCIFLKPGTYIIFFSHWPLGNKSKKSFRYSLTVNTVVDTGERAVMYDRVGMSLGVRDSLFTNRGLVIY